MADAAPGQTGLCPLGLYQGRLGADILRMGASRHLAGDDDFASTMPLSTSIAFGASTGGLYFARQEAVMSRTLIIVGLIMVAVGLLWPWLSRIGLGRLPGDIVIERENFTFYAPISTGILISVVLSIILWLVNR